MKAESRNLNRSNVFAVTLELMIQQQYFFIEAYYHPQPDAITVY